MVCLGTTICAEVSAGLFHGIELQHLVQPSLAVLFVECVDDVPHDRISPVNPMKAMNLLFPDCFVASVKRFRGCQADGLTEADKLSARLITWRRTAGLGILAIALIIATPSFEDA